MPTQDQRGRGSDQQPLCELPRPSAWGRGKRRFLAPVPRPAAPPRHRAAKGARRGSARARRRGTGLGQQEARGPGRGSAPRSRKFPGKFRAGAAGGTMNVFRILGDLSHLLAMILLLVKIWRSKSCAGERPPAAGRGGTGLDQGEDSGSEGTRARELPKTSVKFFDFRGSGRLCGSVASVSTESPTSPPSPHP